MIMSGFRSSRSIQIILAGLLFVIPAFLPAAPSPAPSPHGAIDEKLFKGMQWRQIGPFRGGRALAIEGVPGEAAIRGNTTYGTGVFKSIDGGKTWQNVGLKDTHQIGALIVDPRNENVALVAALGHTFGPNQERGIFRTADGGKTWTKVLSKDENTGGIDVVFDPHNPNIVFASLWQARRQPWFFSSGGPGSG